MSGVPRWGLSPLDWHAHSVEQDAEHPYGVLIAQCGHRLLHPDPPGSVCPSGTSRALR
jgi:hypothetical protein